MGGMGRVRGATCTGHGVTAVACEGSSRCHGRALFALACHGLKGGICGGAWLGWHGRPARQGQHALQRAWAGGAASPLRTAPPPLKEHFGPFWKCLEETSPMLEET